VTEGKGRGGKEGEGRKGRGREGRGGEREEGEGKEWGREKGKGRDTRTPLQKVWLRALSRGTKIFFPLAPIANPIFYPTLKSVAPPIFKPETFCGSSSRQNGRVHGAKGHSHSSNIVFISADAQCITGLRRRQLVSSCS